MQSLINFKPNSLDTEDLLPALPIKSLEELISLQNRLKLVPLSVTQLLLKSDLSQTKLWSKHWSAYYFTVIVNSDNPFSEQWFILLNGYCLIQVPSFEYAFFSLQSYIIM